MMLNGIIQIFVIYLIPVNNIAYHITKLNVTFHNFVFFTPLGRDYSSM